MQKRIVALLTICVLFLAGCAVQEPIQEYTLTSEEQELVDLAYAKRSTWETSKTESIRYVHKNGYDFLLVSNSKGTTTGFDGKPMTVRMETKYTLNTETWKVYEARLDEYGLGDTGLVYGSVSYSPGADATAKKEALGRAISGKSGVINPAA